MLPNTLIQVKVIDTNTFLLFGVKLSNYFEKAKLRPLKEYFLTYISRSLKKRHEQKNSPVCSLNVYNNLTQTLCFHANQFLFRKPPIKITKQKDASPLSFSDSL